MCTIERKEDMPKVLAIIQARLESSRFPLKVLQQIPPGSGVSMLEMVVRKVMLASFVDSVVVVTPDMALVKICKMLNVRYFVRNWQERDVVREFYEAALQENMYYEKEGAIVRITADTPLLHPQEIDKCVKVFRSSNVDLIYNTDESITMFGDGTDVEVTSFEALEKAYQNAKGDEREHVTRWIRRNLKTLYVPVDKDYVGRSVNTCGDYRWICRYLK